MGGACGGISSTSCKCKTFDAGPHSIHSGILEVVWCFISLKNRQFIYIKCDTWQVIDAAEASDERLFSTLMASFQELFA